MKNKLPSISVITPTYDKSLEVLDICLKNVREQNYPQDKIEIILGHGGTEKKIKPIAKKYNAKYILIQKNVQNAEYNRGVAFNKAKNELVLILDHDNFMPTRNFLLEYVKPFLKDKNVVAVESCYYHYDRSFPLMERYFALFGVLDPIPYYLGKADRMRQDSKKWNLLGRSKDMGNYYLVEFEKVSRKIPTVGTNGCLMRRKTVFENADIRPEYHFPIDVMVDVIMSGHNKFAFVKNSLTHRTGSMGFLSFLKRRYQFMKVYHLDKMNKRRYSVYMKGDFWPLIKYLVYSLTFIKPTYDALRGYVNIPDLAWFIHPFMCVGVSMIYGYAVLKKSLVN